MKKTANIVLSTQFLTSLADGMLMFIVIGALKSAGYGLTTIPVMASAFLGMIILFAPFVGPISDSFPKNRVLMVSIFIKILSATALFMTNAPILAYAIAGAAAAIHHTVKWAILPEIANGPQLVKINGINEIVSFGGSLIGVALGGYFADHHAETAPYIVAAINVIAFAISLTIPKLNASNPVESYSPFSIMSDFISTAKHAFDSKTTRFTLAGTSMYSCIVSLTKDLLIVWVPVALFINNNTVPATFANIQTLGIISGAFIVGRIPHHLLHKTTLLGILPGIGLISLFFISNLYVAGIIVFILGMSAGMFKIPINSLAQTRSSNKTGSGRGMAVQSFFQNGSILVFQGVWATAVYFGAGGRTLILGCGIIVTLLTGLIIMNRPHADKMSNAFSKENPKH